MSSSHTHTPTFYDHPSVLCICYKLCRSPWCISCITVHVSAAFEGKLSKNWLSLNMSRHWYRHIAWHESSDCINLRSSCRGFLKIIQLEWFSAEDLHRIVDAVSLSIQWDFHDVKSFELRVFFQSYCISFVSYSEQRNSKVFKPPLTHTSSTRISGILSTLEKSKDKPDHFLLLFMMSTSAHTGKIYRRLTMKSNCHVQFMPEFKNKIGSKKLLIKMKK